MWLKCPNTYGAIVFYPISAINQERHALFSNFTLMARLKTRTVIESKNPANLFHKLYSFFHDVEIQIDILVFWKNL